MNKNSIGKVLRIFLKIFSVICFLGIFLMLYSHASNLMRPKNGTSDLVHNFYDLDKNTIDVLFVGSSLVYHGIQPNVLWNEYGITSFDLASASQSFACSYFLIQEFLKYQSPKVLVLDTYATWNDYYFYNYERLHSAADPLRLNITKLKMLNEMLPTERFGEKLPFYLTLDLYHSRWKELTDQDFYCSPYLKGSILPKGDFVSEEVPVPEARSPVPELVIEYFEKIVHLCEEKDIQLVVIQIPHGKYNGDDWPTFTYDALTISNSFFDYLESNYDIPFKYYALTRELQLDYTTDFKDGAHLNCNGADKLSQNIGKYIDELYDLPDHRGEERFAQWDKDYELYLQNRNQ